MSIKWTSRLHNQISVILWLEVQPLPWGPLRVFRSLNAVAPPAELPILIRKAVFFNCPDILQRMFGASLDLTLKLTARGWVNRLGGHFRFCESFLRDFGAENKATQEIFKRLSVKFHEDPFAVCQVTVRLSCGSIQKRYHSESVASKVPPSPCYDLRVFVAQLTGCKHFLRW